MNNIEDLNKDLTFAQAEEKSYNGCMKFLSQEGSINTLNKTIKTLTDAGKYAEASGVKRALIDYISDKIIVCLDNEEAYNNYESEQYI